MEPPMRTTDNAEGLPCFRLDGRLAVITGASQGIGRQFAEAFARSGARVLLASRREDQLRNVQRTIEAAGGEAEVCVTDVGKLDQIEELAAHARRIADAQGLGLVLVNNAGFAFTKAALEVTEAEYDKVLEVHLKGTFFTCQRLGKVMVERGFGRIINLSSTWSVSTDAGKSVYCAAKAGISQLTAALATEWGPLGVRVSALAPTTTLTDVTRRSMEDHPERAATLLGRIPLGRFAVPGDLVGAAIFLASPAADFVTGQTLLVDGGWAAR
jgi:NAD(P)-dependent dehydrogenase (short-subunit alcohol dehydrogenase family)